MIIFLLGYTYKSDTYLHYNGSTILSCFDDLNKAIQECSNNENCELIVDSGCNGHGRSHLADDDPINFFWIRSITIRELRNNIYVSDDFDILLKETGELT